MATKSYRYGIPDGVKPDGTVDYVSNGLYFAVESDAMQYGRDLASRWFAPNVDKGIPQPESLCTGLERAPM